ncbi:MAG: LAGLIDADG family homing endonuclease, partial [Candidatus Aenigmatarchaeota archaeon]
MDLQEKLEKFLREYYYPELVKSLKEERSLSIVFSDLDRYDAILADELLESPERILNVFNTAAASTAGTDEKICVRIRGLPESRGIRIRNLRAVHLGRLWSIDTTIKAASEVKPQIYEAIFECPDCKAKINVLQNSKIVQKPAVCECGRRGDFNLIDKKMFDVRWLKAIEPFEITTGEQPGEITVLLKEDLTTPKMQKKTDPGSNLKIVGIVKEIPKHIKGKLSTNMDIYIEANHVETSQVEFEELEITPDNDRQIKELAANPNVYDMLRASIAPGIFALDDIKDSLVLQLFGGLVHVLPDGSRVRGNIHILITGDPGCLVGDERIILGNGAIAKMQDLGTKHLQNINTDILTGEGGKKRSVAKVFHFYKNQPVIEVITESGKSIKGTYNHPLMCLRREGGIVREWKRLDEIKIGDRLAVVTSIPCTITKEVGTNFKPVPRKYGPKFKGKLPKVCDENLAAFMGYILGDGCVGKYEVGFLVAESEIDILGKLLDISEGLFSIRPSVKKRKIKPGFLGDMLINRKQAMAYASVNSMDIASNMGFVKAKRVPDIILRSGNKAVASFLKWLYEADGCAFDKGRGRRSISLKSKNIELLRDVQILLLRFAIHSRIVGNDNLMIRRGESMIKFAKHVGFVSKKKCAKLYQLAKSAENFRRFKSQRSERVVKVIKHKPEDVFDIEVPRTHRFIANGIISHNTGKTQLLKLISSAVPRGRYVSGTGASGAGLCTIYDSLVQLEDGTITKIGEFVEKYSSQLKKEEEGVYCAEIEAPKIMSFDQDLLKIKPMKITHVWKLKSPDKLIRITARSGKEITVTKDNPLPIIKNGEIIWKPASGISIGEFLATPRKLVHSSKDANMLRFIDKKARIKNCSSIVASLIDKIKSESTIKEVVSETGVPESGLYWLWKHEQGSPLLGDLIKVSERMGVDLEKFIPEEIILTQQRGHTIRLPKKLNENIMYLFGLIAGDGDIQKTSYGGYSLRFHSADEELLDIFNKIASSEFNINPYFYKHPERIAYLRINSKILGEIAKKLGMIEGKKSHSICISKELSSLPTRLITAYLQGLFDTDGYVSERKTKGSDSIGFTTVSREFAYGIVMLLLRFGITAHIRERKPTLSFIRDRKVQSGKKYEIEIRGRTNILNFRNYVGFRLARKNKKLEIIISKTGNENTNVDVIPEISSLMKQARLCSGLTSRDIFGHKNYEFEKGRINPSRNMLSKIVSRLDPKNDMSRRLEIFANSDIFWDEIKSIDEVNGEEFVYDVTVEKDHSFVANGMIIHNTATVVKNEAIGGWVLEAGALILCNKGLIAIDEFDKMNRDDQIAMHEATSVETVSIAKASIVATLPAQTAVLAGANPKFGRFDPYTSIGEQIQIPETLLSRFDLKFALRDIPDRNNDERIAEHIIISRTRPDMIEPPIPMNLLRKYIAYARQINSMELAEETSNMLKNFYVDMRNRYGSTERQAVSITLRQYEALIRLAEASARVRLDNTIRKEDAERAIRLMMASLKQLGYDTDTETFDVDRLEGGVTASKRTKLLRILKILDDLQKESKEVAIDDLKAEAENQGVEDVDDVIGRLEK